MNCFSKIFSYCALSLVILTSGANLLYAQVESMFGAHNQLLGKTGTGHDQSRISSFQYNPAHISEVKRPGFNLASGLSYHMYSYRYLGDITRSSSQLDISGIPLPTIAYPISNSIILGGFLIPFPVSIKLNAKKIPLGLLGQLNLADLSGSATLKMYIDLYTNLLKTSFLSIGTQITYYAFEAEVGVNANGYSGDHLVDVNLTNSALSLKLGVKAKINSRLYLGFSSILFSSTTTTTSISTILDNKEDDSSSSNSNDTTTTKSNVPIKNIRVGVTFKIHPRLLAYTDLEYSRESGGKELSLVDFVEKNKDVSDTLSVYIGSEFILSPTYQILAGAFYEPSPIGVGSRGKDGKIGFGFMNLAMGLGAPPQKPAWGVAAGIRSGFMKIHKKKQSTVFERYSPYYALNIDVGAVFSMTSIGIPDTGEQPASYEVTRFNVPVEISYIF